MASALLFAPAAFAQEQSGVLTYAPDFFAGTQPDTAYDMLARVPGFAVDFGSGARGLAGATGNVLIDGRPPATKSDTLYDVLRRIPAKSVARIELIRGGAPGIDMQGHAMIANIVLKRAETRETAIEGNAYIFADGGFDPTLSFQTSHSRGDDREELKLAASSQRTATGHGRRILTDAAGTILERASLDQGGRYHSADARGSLQRRVGGGLLQLHALASYTDTDTRQAIDILPIAGADDTSRDSNRVSSGELGVDWTRPLGGKDELQITALQRASAGRYDSASLSAGTPSTFDADTDTGESILRAVLRHRPSARLSFEGGGEVAYNFLDSATAYAERGVPVPLPNARIFVDELRGEGFGQATWQPSGKLTVEAGLRVELSRIAQHGDTRASRSFVYPKPRLQLSWRPADGHELRLRVEKSVTQLDFNDFAAATEINLGTVLGGNGNLVPQQMLAFEASYERRFWGKGAFSLIARHTLIDDAIDAIPLAGDVDAIGNIGSGTLDELESSLTLPFDRLGLKNARLDLSGTLRRSHVTDPLTGERRRLSGEVPFECSIAFSQDLKGGRFTYGAMHDCNTDRSLLYRVLERRETYYGPFLTLYGQWKPSPSLTLRLDLGNLADARSGTIRDVHAGPRNLTPIDTIERRALWRGQYALVTLRKAL